MLLEKVVALSEKSDKLSDSLTEKFEALFPSWPEMLATLLSLAILMFVLGPLVYKGVKNMVAKRRKYIQDNIDHAEKMNNESVIDREKANIEILQARTIADEIISKAKLDAEKVKARNISSAKDEANKIVALAKADILREREHFEIEARKEMISVAMVAAKKVVEKQINPKTSQKIIEDFINSEESGDK